MNKKPRILVVGSLAMDLIVDTPRFPHPGETVMGAGYHTAPGGKGANQAVQAARLGADVTMVGCVGCDDFGKRLISSLQDAGVHTEHIRQMTDVSTGITNIQIETKGKAVQNSIVLIPGTNMRLSAEDLDFLKNEISQYDMLLLQFEIPMAVNELAAAIACEAGVPVMVNTAPSAPVSDELLTHITFISPNEHEAQDLTGIAVTDETSAKACADALLAKGVRNVMITCGERGAVLRNAEGFLVSPAVYCEHVVDPTAAGDSYVASFCTAVCCGASMSDAMRFANCAAHITVSRFGAQPSMPMLDEVLTLMDKKGFQHSYIG